MDSVIRGLVVYAFLLAIFRISGKRTLAETTSFDLILLLIISETTQQAMVDNDHSVVNAFLLILTLVGTSIGLSLLKQKFPKLEQLIDGTPLTIIENGVMHKERMDKLRIDENDVMEAARQIHGLENLGQVKHAVVERSGSISIIPK